jgi:tetratricopeptide (TPR) repeat protein
MVVKGADVIGSKLQRAVALHQAGDLQRARSAYEQILSMEPTQADALHLSGVIAAQTGNPAKAVDLIGKAVQIDPTNAAAFANLGSALHALKDLEGALAAYDRSVAIQQGFARAHFLRGNVLYELKMPEPAVASYDAAIALQPDFIEAYSNRGNALFDLRQLSAALASYDQALARNPDFVDALSNRGNVLRELNRYEEALASYDRALSVDATNVLVHFNRGVALNQLKQPEAALASYDRSIALRPDFAEAHFNRSLVSLLMGDFRGGWPEHEWRWKNRFGSNIRERRKFTEPLWLGEQSLAGRSILLYAEQGYGDTLQFCRYVRHVADLGAQVILEVPETLQTLMSSLDGVAELIVAGHSLPRFDYQCPLMSLPLAFKTEIDTIPSQCGYLRSDPARTAQWRTRLGEKTAPRVGLMWNGNATQPNDRNRSFWLAEWIPYLPSGFQYVSLQRNLRNQDARTLQEHPHIMDCAAELRDFGDTAALCDCMDLIISVCTSVAHLSGALGKPTWVLLSHAADWRWLLDRADSPWYPSATLYRQPQRGDWVAVYQRVARDLVHQLGTTSVD